MKPHEEQSACCLDKASGPVNIGFHETNPAALPAVLWVQDQGLSQRLPLKMDFPAAWNEPAQPTLLCWGWRKRQREKPPQMAQPSEQSGCRFLMLNPQDLQGPGKLSTARQSWRDRKYILKFSPEHITVSYFESSHFLHSTPHIWGFCSHLLSLPWLRCHSSLLGFLESVLLCPTFRMSEHSDSSQLFFFCVVFFFF